MAISGHKTRSVFNRYNIVNEADLEVAAGRLQEYINREKVTLSVTLAELTESASEVSTDQAVEMSEEKLVPPIRIERTTNGLGNRCSIQLSYGGILCFQSLTLADWLVSSTKCYLSVSLEIPIKFLRGLCQVTFLYRIIPFPHLF